MNRMKACNTTLAAVVALSGFGIAKSATASAADSCTGSIPTAVTLTNADGGSELGAGWAAKIGINLTNLDGCASGSKAVIEIPKEIGLGQVGKVVPLKDADGNLVASAEIGDGKVTIELTDFASTHRNVGAHFEAWASASEALNTTETVTLSWVVNGEVVTTVVQGQPSVGVPQGQMPDEMGKGGHYDANASLIRIGIRTPINHTGKPFEVVDKLTTGGQIIDCGALNIDGKQFSAVDEKGDEADSADLDISVKDCNSGSVTFALSPEKGFAGQIYFDVKVTEPTAGVWKDTAKGLQNGAEVGSASARVIDYGASGGGLGEGIPLPPTEDPTGGPETPPATEPTDEPAGEPNTQEPTGEPTTKPSDEPTTPVTDNPTGEPSKPATEPTVEPTEPETKPTDDKPKGEPAKPSTDKPSTDKPVEKPSNEPKKDSEPSKDTPAPAKSTAAPSGATEVPQKPSIGPKVETDGAGDCEGGDTAWLAIVATAYIAAIAWMIGKR